MKDVKRKVLEILSRKDISGSLPDLDALPPQKVLGPLFSGILNADEHVRWHAVTAMGHVAGRLALGNLEQGRIVMRRLMWSLNDESGGIGWGAPECMGEIMAMHDGLAEEYHEILFSYLVERQGGADNYLEYLPLRRGAFWGLSRLNQQRPDIGAKAGYEACKALADEEDPFIMACLCKYFQQQGGLPGELTDKIRALKDQMVSFYWDRNFSWVSLRDVCAG